jgi:hypothetical protein
VAVEQVDSVALQQGGLRCAERWKAVTVVCGMDGGGARCPYNHACARHTRTCVVSYVQVETVIDRRLQGVACQPRGLLASQPSRHTKLTSGLETVPLCVHYFAAACAGLPPGPHILLTTYKLVQQLPQQTLGRYHVVIVDESHKLKNPTTDQ